MYSRNPQNNSFVISKRYYYAQDFFGLIVLLLSIFQTETSFLSSRLFLIITGVVLILEFIMGCFHEVYFNKGHYIRESALLDNSFKEKRIPNYNSDLYFNNCLINVDIIKLLANLHENTLFTFKIAGKMSIRYYIGACIATGFFLFKLFLSGMDDYSSILLSFIISSSFLKRAFKLSSLKKSSEEIFEEANKLCSNYEKKPSDKNKLLSNILELLLKYENIVFESKIILDKKIFIKENKIISDEWENIKKTYSVYKVRNNQQSS